MADDARHLAELLGDPRATEHLHQHALRLEAMVADLERGLSDE
jgi:hypothetical protein